MAAQDVRVWDGTQWISIVGPAGADGADGSPGQKGDQGDQGDPGVPGADGADGADGPAGADGLAATVGVGTVTEGPLQVTNAGTAQNAVLNFVIPKGEKGDVGAAAVIKGTTTVWPPNATPALNDLYIIGTPVPAGAPAGSKPGDGVLYDGADWLNVGPIQGPEGPQGTPGTAATVAVGTVTDGPTAQVTNSGTATAAVLNFVLKQGAPGADGADGAPGAPGADGADGVDGENNQVFVQTTTPILPRAGAIWIVQ
jgi:hypothetical protein